MPRRENGLPSMVNLVSKKLASGEKVKYGFFGRERGALPLGRYGTPEFYAALAEALSQAPPEGSVHSLIYSYRQSQAYVGLQDRTRADYGVHLDRIKDHFGELSLRAMSAPRMADLIERWRDGLKVSKRQADYAATVLGVLLAWGVKKGRLTHNRAAGLEKIYRVDRSERTWSDDQVAALLKVAPEPIARALVLALETGISQGDLLRLTWAADEGEIITGRRQKTGAAFAVPVSQRLRQCLDAAPRGDAVQILTKLDGRPWDLKGNGFRDAWRLACRDAAIEGVTFNDLRGTFITSRRMMGWTAEQVALCSGHPIAGERGAQRSYANRKAIATENAKRLHANFYGPDQEQKLQTGVQTRPPSSEARS